MFYKVELKDHIRVSPMYFGSDLKDSVTKSIKLKYDGLINADLGVVIDVMDVKEIGEGIVIAGDGAGYYETIFNVIVFRPEMQEVIKGRIRDIADFGAFITMGPIDGMIHVSQTMDDFVSFSKEKVLSGRDSKKSLRVGDECKARIIAVSFKDITNPKIGLTMRQQGLGKLDWILEEKKPAKTAKESPAKSKKKKGKK